MDNLPRRERLELDKLPGKGRVWLEELPESESIDYLHGRGRIDCLPGSERIDIYLEEEG